MEIPEKDKRCWELVLMKYGMRIEWENGEKLYNFEHFDIAGFKQNGPAEIRRVRELLPLDLNNEWDFTASPFAQEYRAAFLREVEHQAVEQGTEIPDNVLKLMETAYNHGFDDGGNFACKIFTGEL